MRRNYLLESWTGLLVLHDGRTMLQRASMLSLARKSRYYHSFPKGTTPRHVISLSLVFVHIASLTFCLLFCILKPLIFKTKFNCHLQSAAILD